ncbi:MAG: family 43 glycosylhydrolase, partial [Bacteroides sp.]|nr:family 43 glycosylhydrolase [Bacteroides sp.]
MTRIHLYILLTLALFALAACGPEKQSEASMEDAGKNYHQASIDSSRVLITNPVIPGFNPDPCMIRVDDDYYILTSTFEWFPGIAIYHSKDLASWEAIGHVLTRESQADLRGIGSSSGIYAPSIHYHDGRFYVLYTIVSGDYFPNLSTPNYIVWADNIEGPWSDPVYINSTGFDPALYFDDDGKCYYMNMLLDFNSETVTGGITLQDFDIKSKTTTSEALLIFPGTMHGTEGPRIYKRNGYYYLLTAEGGTQWNHQVTVCRSKVVRGPYELAPNTPLLTSRDHPEHPLQRAGHASLAATPDGEWYMAHLASRPVMPERRSVLGRETCIQKLEWIDDWPQLRGGGSLPHLLVEGPPKGSESCKAEIIKDEFEENALPPIYQTLRLPMDESWLSLSRKPGSLAL